MLLAAATDTPVKPIDPAMADFFASERELGTLPLEDAFARLAEREPGLRALAEDPDLAIEPPRESGPQRVKATTRRHELVGIGARSGDPLLASDLAASIVHHYLLVRSGRLPEADLRTSYFDAPRKLSVRGGSFFGPGRRRARN